MPEKSTIKRGEVYWVNLDPTIGSEIKKTRPGVIVSNDAQNMVGARVIVAPLTTVVKKVYPFEARVSLVGTESKVLLDQIRTVDCKRLGKRMGKLSIKEMENVDRALKLVLAIA